MADYRHYQYFGEATTRQLGALQYRPPRRGGVGALKLATQLAPKNITVNNVAPGYTGTDRVSHIFEDAAARQGITEAEAAAAVTNAILAT